MLLCYSLCRSLLDFQFQFNFSLLSSLYPKFRTFYSNILPPYSSVLVTCVGGSPYIVSIHGHGERKVIYICSSNILVKGSYPLFFAGINKSVNISKEMSNICKTYR